MTNTWADDRELIVFRQLQALALLQRWRPHNDPHQDLPALLPQDLEESYQALMCMTELASLILEAWLPGQEQMIFARLRSHIIEHGGQGYPRHADPSS